MFRNAMLGTALAVLLVPAVAEAAKDRIVIGQQQEPSSLDPTADATAVIDTIFTGNVFQTLTELGQQSNILPSVAQSWDVSDDGLVYTFRLQQGLKFTDGTDLTAETVKFAFDRAMAPDSVNPSKGIFKPIQKVEAVDPHTVRMTLSAPDNLFLYNMSRGDAAIVAPASADTNKTQPVGSGPYKFKSWTKGDRLTLELNPMSPLAAKAQLREVTYKFTTDPAASVAAILAGDIDAFPNLPAVESLAQFEADPRFTVAVGSTGGEVILALNNDRKPLDDVRVRRAIQMAIDRSAIIEGAMFGYGQQIGSFFAPHHVAYVDLTDRYPYDPAKAKAAIEAAGAAGAKLTLQPPPFPYAKRSAEIIAQMLNEVGLAVEVQNVEWPFWISEVYKKKQYDMTIVAHVEWNDYGNLARGKDYYWSYDNPATVDLVDYIRRQTDPVAANAALAALQMIGAHDAPAAYLFQLPQTGVYAKGLSGYWVSSVGGSTTPLVDYRWAE